MSHRDETREILRHCTETEIALEACRRRLERLLRDLRAPKGREV
jgi:hypothetical protein